MEKKNSSSLLQGTLNGFLVLLVVSVLKCFFWMIFFAFFQAAWAPCDFQLFVPGMISFNLPNERRARTILLWKLILWVPCSKLRMIWTLPFLWSSGKLISRKRLGVTWWLSILERNELKRSEKVYDLKTKAHEEELEKGHRICKEVLASSQFMSEDAELLQGLFGLIYSASANTAQTERVFFQGKVYRPFSAHFIRYNYIGNASCSPSFFGYVGRNLPRNSSNVSRDGSSHRRKRTSWYSTRSKNLIIFHLFASVFRVFE